MTMETRISFAAIVKDSAAMWENLGKTYGKNPYPPKYAAALRELAALIEKCKEVDWSHSTDWRGRLLAQLAAGFDPSNPRAEDGG